MQLLLVNEIFSGKLVQALCWMLVNSMWMGLLLAVIAGFIVLYTKNKTAVLRYNLLSGALLLFTVASMIVFVLQLDETVALQSVTGSTSVATTGTYSGFQTDTGSINKAIFTRTLVDFFNNHAGVIVLCWLLIIAFRTLQFAGGLYKIHQLRNMRLTPVSDHWKQQLQQLAATLQIRSKIQLLESGIATIPMVLGHFKPVILFPIGLLNALPASQVEAVLLHELAHIRRKDYVVNLLQHMVEIVFFFNPAVLWVSALIKTERENCCDDIALAYAANKRNYINALLSFQEYQLEMPQYATAFATDKNQLLQRVKRMLYNNNKTLNNMEKTFLTVCFAATVSLAVFFTATSSAQSNPSTANTAQQDTTLSIANRHYDPNDFKEGASVGYSEKINGISHTLYIFKRNGVLYEIYGDVTSFKIDGKPVPQAEWGKYKLLISQLKAEYAKQQAETMDATASADKLKAEQLALLAQKSALSADMQQQQSTDKLSAEQQALLAQQDQQKAASQSSDKLPAEKLALLALQDKMNAELNALQSSDKLSAEQLSILAQQNKLKAEQDFLKNADQLRQDGDTLKLQKLKAEQQQLLFQKEKLKAEQQQLLLQKEKIKAEQTKQVALQFKTDLTNKKLQTLKLQFTKQQNEFKKATEKKQGLKLNAQS